MILDQFRLDDRVALVTGASAGLGQAIAIALAEAGAELVCHGNTRSPQTTCDLISKNGRTAVAISGDLAKSDTPRKLIDAALEKCGRLDILVNNAGTSGTTAPIDFKDLDRMTEEFWSAILSTNLLGPFRCSHAAAPALKAAQGAIVNTASVAGLGAIGSSVAYGASKAALVNLTKNLARALSPEVRVNAVAPGLVDSPWTKTWPEERKRDHVAKTLIHRMVTPEDIAETMLFLTAGGAMITGQTIAVDGGMSW
jgi:3-oxoacyl-[acyl-carrier protein] reductase